jgi:hypothetical protein
MRPTMTVSELLANRKQWIYKHAADVFFDVPELLEIYLKLYERNNA